MEKPIFNPLIPYIGPIYGGKFSPQKMVRIQGTVPSIAYRFDINLQCSPQTHPRSNIAVQVSVRLVDGYISLNSLENGIWGEEDRRSIPINCDQNFEIIILCDFDKHKVAINGQHYCEFPHRMHYNHITHLAIDGDVSIARITYESAASAPDLTPPVRNDDDFEMVDSSDIPLLKKPSPIPQPRVSQPSTYGITFPPPSTSAPHPLNLPPPPAPGLHAPDLATPSFSVPPYLSSTVPLAPPVHPYQTGAPATSYPPPGAPGIHPSPPSPGIHAPPSTPGFYPLSPTATVPLNSPFSTVQPVKHFSVLKCCYICCAITFGVIFIIAIVVAKFARTYEMHSQASKHGISSHGNNYGSNYGHDSYPYSNDYD